MILLEKNVEDTKEIKVKERWVVLWIFSNDANKINTETASHIGDAIPCQKW